LKKPIKENIPARDIGSKGRELAREEVRGDRKSQKKKEKKKLPYF